VHSNPLGRQSTPKNEPLHPATNKDIVPSSPLASPTKTFFGNLSCATVVEAQNGPECGPPRQPAPSWRLPPWQFGPPLPLCPRPRPWQWQWRRPCQGASQPRQGRRTHRRQFAWRCQRGRRRCQRGCRRCQRGCRRCQRGCRRCQRRPHGCMCCQRRPHGCRLCQRRPALAGGAPCPHPPWADPTEGAGKKTLRSRAGRAGRAGSYADTPAGVCNGEPGHWLAHPRHDAGRQQPQPPAQPRNRAAVARRRGRSHCRGGNGGRRRPGSCGGTGARHQARGQGNAGRAGTRVQGRHVPLGV
jgi:hypothetical protein